MPLIHVNYFIVIIIIIGITYDLYFSIHFITNYSTQCLVISIQTPGLNIITEYIMGIILPGRPIANVCFKTYGYMSMAQAVSFLSDFKLGHYMKIPPRSMFLVQVCYLLPNLRSTKVVEGLNCKVYSIISSGMSISKVLDYSSLQKIFLTLVSVQLLMLVISDT